MWFFLVAAAIAIIMIQFRPVTSDEQVCRVRFDAQLVECKPGAYR